MKLEEMRVTATLCAKVSDMRWFSSQSLCWERLSATSPTDFSSISVKHVVFTVCVRVDLESVVDVQPTTPV